MRQDDFVITILLLIITLCYAFAWEETKQIIVMTCRQNLRSRVRSAGVIITKMRPHKPSGHTSEAKTDRIDRRPIWDQAYAILRAQILDGRLAPGTLLNLRDLAAQLSISVTPVRDAVLRLVADRLVEDGENRELRVTQLLKSEIEQTLDLRILLEQYALEQSASKLTQDDFERLEALLMTAEKLLQEPSEEAGRQYTELGTKFHYYLVEAADNRPLLDLYEHLYPQAFLVIERSFHGFPPDRNREDHLEHMRLFDALRRRAHAEAIQLLKEHLEQVRIYTLGGNQTPS